MKMLSTRTVLVAVMSLGLAAAACKKKESEPAQDMPKPAEPAAAEPAPAAPPAEPPMAAKNIVETAKEAGSFTTLLKAVEAAGLVETLSGPGPFTVFAPTDEAFAKIPAADLTALLADKAKLTAVLTYHVVSGAVPAKDVATMTSAKTVQGGELKLDASSGVKVNDATVIKPDVTASNGVIHVIDTVLMPK
jgi:uncharacterized surface protein with fasciclin (FAS1) repeats